MGRVTSVVQPDGGTVTALGRCFRAPGEGHIRSGKCDRELLRRRIVALVVIGPESVVEELARVKSLAVPITQDKLDAGAVLVGKLDAGAGSELVHDVFWF
jgi:hypothetical protein